MLASGGPPQACSLPPSLSWAFRCSGPSLLASPEFRLNCNGAGFFFFLWEGLNLMSCETLEKWLPVPRGTARYCWSHKRSSIVFPAVSGRWCFVLTWQQVSMNIAAVWWPFISWQCWVQRGKLVQCLTTRLGGSHIICGYSSCFRVV